MRRNILLIIAAILLVSTAAYAHHSYAATYDTTKEVKVEGILVQFELRNPHAFVTVKAQGQGRRVATLVRRMGRRLSTGQRRHQEGNPQSRR